MSHGHHVSKINEDLLKYFFCKSYKNNFNGIHCPYA